MNKLKKYFLIFLLIELMFAYVPAYASTVTYSGPQQQIADYLCAPSTGSNSSALFTCINQLYKFAIALACTVGVFFIVIAGYVYMSAEGNQESVDKAKSILVSTIVSLVILFAGFLLLKTLNPDLVNLQPIVLPNATGSVIPPAPTTGLPTGGTTGTPSTGVTSGSQLPTSCTTTYCAVGSPPSNIAAYATDPSYDAAIMSLYNGMANADFTTAAGITAYMQSKVPSTPLTGDMVLSAANTYGVDPKVMVAIMQQDSSLGTQGKGAKSNNPGNVGSTSTGSIYDTGNQTTTFPNMQAGVNAVAQWLGNHPG
jgi:hypothetical protein